MSLYDKDHWKSVEKHTATLPTSWNDRLNLDDVVSTQLIWKDLMKENLGLHEFTGPTIESICKESACFTTRTFQGMVVVFEE
ncbi:hypothetical protein HPULCUR_007247 [Helicostylum pulchrum]|uniref:Uncharacterized protein n=1 Tax=Helicostylum pulchrum TaxID=562976 RepID=A0ABP9Y470_9FUNG